LCQLARVGLAQFRVGDEAVAALVGLQRGVDVFEARFDFLRQLRVLFAQQRLDRFERRLGAFDVGLEVDQVDVRVALLLAGDLRGGDLASSSLAPLAIWTRLQVTVFTCLQFGDVGQQLPSATGAMPAAAALLPERLLDPWSRPIRAGTSFSPGVDAGSRSPKDSATGSIRSYGMRAPGTALFASATSPARTAATKGFVLATSSPVFAPGRRGTRQTAASTSGLLRRAPPLTVSVPSSSLAAVAAPCIALLQGQREAAERPSKVLLLAEDRFAVEDLELGHRRRCPAFSTRRCPAGAFGVVRAQPASVS
jgi:hypothetical protein